MKSAKSAIPFVFLLIFCALPALANSPSPAATLNTAYEKVRAIVAAEKGRTPEPQINEMLKTVIAPLFDFEKLTRLSLGAYWKRGSAAEQSELIALLSDLLARTYLKQVTRGVELIAVEEIREKVDGDKAVVTAVVTAKGVRVTTHAKLHLRPDGWKIYDVAVENIGLVTNYRNEFPAIVRREGFAGLIDRLRKKRNSKMGELPVNPAQHFPAE